MKAKYVLYYIVPIVAVYFSTVKLKFFLWNNDWSKDPVNIVETIQTYTGVSKTHRVQTEDGYILTFFQIPRENPKGVILLQHPIFYDARLWVSQYNDSIAFLFWRAGYDVWLGNIRGNYFSKEHVTFALTNPTFWNFSFHEMGYYDHHATIEYIRRNTSQSKIIYLGYSMGATSGLVYASTRPKDASRSLKMMLTLAPATHVFRCTSIAKYIGPPYFFLRDKFNFVDVSFTVMRYDVWYLRAFRLFFSVFPCRRCIIYFYVLITGSTFSEMEPDLVDEKVRVFGSEIPLKVLDHFIQMCMFGGEIRMYDYGEKGNLQMYGDLKPQFYPLEYINIPIFLIYPQNGSFIISMDNEYLYSLLPRSSTPYGKLEVEDFSHADFSHGRNRNEKVYNKILKLLEVI